MNQFIMPSAVLTTLTLRFAFMLKVRGENTMNTSFFSPQSDKKVCGLWDSSFFSDMQSSSLYNTMQE